MTASPETLPLTEDRPPRALRRRVDELLRRGSVVALPSETVYGLAVRADHEEAVAALRRRVGEDAGSPLTWNVGDRDALRDFPRVSPVVQRLVARYWPGPLTLVLPGVPAGLGPVADDGWTAVRFPAHRGTAGLLAELGYPVAVAGASAPGGPPCAEASAVAAAFGDAVALIVDGGPSRIGEPSSVLAVGEGRFEMRRGGLVSLEDLRRTAGLRIGFVCTGNTCRSPMAEGLARSFLRERLGLPRDGDLGTFGFAVTSMGVFAGPGSPPSAHAVAVLAEHHIDITGHRSRPALPEAVGELDVVYGLTRSHVDSLTAALPPGKARHVQLLDPEGRDVPDPIGGDLLVYRAAAEHIARSLRARLDEWA